MFSPHRTRTRLTPCAAILAATALVLSGCTGSGTGDQPAPTAEMTEIGDNAEASPVTEASTDPDDEAWEYEPTVVDPARFEAHSGYIVAAWDAGLRGCGIDFGGDVETFQCAIDFATPIGPHQSDHIATEDGKASAIQYQSVYGFYPVSDRFAGQWAPGEVAELGVDEQVTIGGFTITRMEEDAVLIERGAHWFWVTGGEYMPFNSAAGAIETDPSEYEISTSASAEEGAICGIIETEPGIYSYVMSMAHGTNCPIAYEVAADYISPNRSGDEPQGSAGFWDGPHGWSCSRGYLSPGMDDIGANKMPVCSAENMRGDAGEGSGSVAIVPTPYLG